MEAAASAACIAAAAAAKDAAAAAAFAKEAAVLASAAALHAKEAAVMASAVASDAKEAAAVAAMQASKKRKFHLINDGQDPPGSADADDVERLDFISRLPDAVLGSIVSLLPTKEGARTQAVSRRWRPIWHSAPLSLVADSELRSKGRTTVDLIAKILSQHPGPARRFSFSLGVADFSENIEAWLSSQALNDLQELELRVVDGWKVVNLQPASVFRFAPTLRVANFYGYSLHLPDLIMQLPLNFPCLKHLKMQYVTISEDALQSMLSSCAALESLELKDNGHFCISSQTLKFPSLKMLILKGVTISQDALQNIFSSCHALESLQLFQNSGIGRLCIRSQTLKSLVFSFDCGWWNLGCCLKELIIEDAPCLERLLQLETMYDGATLRVISAPKLKILGILSENEAELHIGTTVFQKMIAVSLTTKLHTMRDMILYSVGPNLDAVVNFLKCFPCLERLYVIFQSEKRNNGKKYDPLDPIECLELHLKEVVLRNYDGTRRSSINFAKFFVLNAKVLKEMKITLPYHRHHDWFVKQHKLLQFQKRASQDARIELKCGTEYDFTPNGHIHDFSMADPFDMPSSRNSKCCCCPF